MAVNTGKKTGSKKLPRSKTLAPGIDYEDPSLYFNRELSWLKFNERVLEEAESISNPLMERLRFTMICESNLDEFFMVRVAGLKQLVANNIEESGPDQLSAREQLSAITTNLEKFYSRLYKLLNGSLIPELKRKGIQFCSISHLPVHDKKAIEKYFRETIYPILTPLAIDQGHPFPRLANRSLNLAVLLKKTNGKQKRNDNSSLFAVVQVPNVLDRLFKLPSSSVKKSRYVWLEDIITYFIHELFSGFKLKKAFPFKITRDSDLIIEEDEVDDLLMTIQQELRRREKGAAVRLELPPDVPTEILENLKADLEITNSDIFFINGALPISGYRSLFEDPLLEKETFKPFTPVSQVEYEEKSQIFKRIRDKDIMVHLPFDSFSLVEDFLIAAAEDKNVLAIKQTLYRTGGKSAILDALIQAARNGKQVTALVELKARFDEETNIQWAKKLEEEGIHVVYGLPGMKIHAKMCLVVRREDDKIIRYVHLSSGNYNSSTARLYTDIGLFTHNKQIADDVTHLFNSITGYSKLPKLERLITSPAHNKNITIQMIKKEAEHAQKGQPASIIAKMNSLVDKDVIQALYMASSAGVKITLMIRGICCLKPGLRGISDNIEVISTVGRLLEHSRIIIFENLGNHDITVSSADWMPRNFHRRIEVSFPILDTENRKRILEEVIPLYSRDNAKSRTLLSDGSYLEKKKKQNEDSINTQEQLIERARRALENRNPQEESTKTIPVKELKVMK